MCILLCKKMLPGQKGHTQHPFASVAFGLLYMACNVCWHRYVPPPAFRSLLSSPYISASGGVSCRKFAVEIYVVDMCHGLCVQVLMVLLHTAVAYWMLCRAVNTKASTLLSKQQQAYLWGFAPLEIYCAAVHPLMFVSKLPFLPLLLTSVYSALGLGFCWLQMAACWLPRYSLSTHAHVQ